MIRCLSLQRFVCCATLRATNRGLTRATSRSLSLDKLAAVVKPEPGLPLKLQNKAWRKIYAKAYPRSSLLPHVTQHFGFIEPPSSRGAQRAKYSFERCVAARADLMRVRVLDLLDDGEGERAGWAIKLDRRMKEKVNAMEDDVEACLDRLEAGYQEANGHAFAMALKLEEGKLAVAREEERKKMWAERQRKAEEELVEKEREGEAEDREAVGDHLFEFEEDVEEIVVEARPTKRARVQ